MPTGYTSDIKDGIDFKTFAMNCARAFGACVTLRDAPGGGEHIPDAFEPSDYHAKALDNARAELETLQAMTPEEREKAAEREWKEAVSRQEKHREDKRTLRKAYESMLSNVLAWQPPTPDHVEMKRFMRDQLEESIRFDCTIHDDTPVARLSGDAWADKRRTQLWKDIEYHERKHAQEVDRAATRTAWIQALRASL